MGQIADINGLNLFSVLYILGVTGCFGLIIGSFLNVVILRLFSGESIVFPCSKCPKCSTPIKWYDNIPILSYILLGGKCRQCKENISIQYPIVEGATAILFMFTVYTYGLGLKSLLLCILISGLIIITVTDIKEKVIFDITSIPLIPLGLLYNFFDFGMSGSGVVKIPLAGINATLSLNEAFISAIIGAIIGALFFEIFSRVGLLCVGEYAFGEGDSIIGAALGAWFGWKMIIIILILSFVVQLIVGLPIIIANMYKDKDFKSIIFTGLMIVSIFIPYIGQMTGISKSLAGALIITLVAVVLALSGVVVVLKRTKERKSFTFIAFGPALVFGGIAVMFWGPQIASWYLQHYQH